MIAYYEPEIITAFDYYPFGMMSRMWYDSDYPNYRFGFNGKEMDHEAKGNFAQLDYGFRIYDPRIGRFLSVDPLTEDYPGQSPYPFAMNRPIDGIDLDGMEFYSPNSSKVSVDVIYNPQLKKIDDVGAWIIYINVANGLKKKIHENLDLPGNYFDEDVNPGGLRVANLSFRDIVDNPHSLENHQEALDQREGTKHIYTYKYYGPRQMLRFIKRRNPYAGLKLHKVNFLEGEAKANKLEVYVEVAKWLLEFAYDKFEKEYEIPTIKYQGSRMVHNVYKYITQALQENMIPEVYRNSESLTAIGNYLVYGEVPMQKNGVHTIENKELLNIAKEIWKKIKNDMEVEMLKLLDENKPGLKRDNTNAVIHTPAGVKNN